jgi:hypothetical protein
MPAINDANLSVGVLNKDDYRGGGIQVSVDTSHRVSKEKAADPLGLDVYVAAKQRVDLVNVLMFTD